MRACAAFHIEGSGWSGAGFTLPPCLCPSPTAPAQFLLLLCAYMLPPLGHRSSPPRTPLHDTLAIDSRSPRAARIRGPLTSGVDTHPHLGLRRQWFTDAPWPTWSVFTLAIAVALYRLLCCPNRTSCAIWDAAIANPAIHVVVLRFAVMSAYFLVTRPYLRPRTLVLPTT